MSDSNTTQTFTPDSLETLRSHFVDLDPSKHGSKWNQLWAEKFAPWDRGQPSPALDDVLAERKDLLGSRFIEGGKTRKKALVPGCGMGYDVLLLSAFGYDAYGLELSENALNGARKLHEESKGKEEYRVRDKIVGRGKVTYLSGDFFKHDFLKGVDGEGTFDIIYDYTVCSLVFLTLGIEKLIQQFLCALPPSLRPAWAKRQSELLSPMGRLICLEFPSTKPLSTGGPPHALPPRVYEGHLRRPGQELLYDAEGHLLQANLGPELESGLVRLEHFHPKRTHSVGVGKDGNVEDWIGVWGHNSHA